ncbi:MAG: dihydrolipoyl dehydrogenase [Myxococcales bacterium]|nr:dihydrolipoyl dehydrogenase [Myxococcales bacterium]
MTTTYDVVVIGSGPGGYVAAIRAGQLGLNTAIVEKDDRFGGTCLLRGCIPTKSMLESASLADHARHADDFGVNVGDVSIDIGKVLKRKDRVIKANAGGVAFLLKKNKVTTYRGFGALKGAGKVTVTADDGVTELSAKHIILATGSAVRHFPGFDVDGERILTSDELLELAEIPKHLLVLGAGAVGVEFASVYRSFGADVTIVELQDRLVPLEDEEVSAEFAKAFKRRGIKVKAGTKCLGLELDGQKVKASFEEPGGKQTNVRVSHCLVAIGRRPVTEGLGLDKTKIKSDRGFLKTDEYGLTDEPGIYAIGDIVAGTPQLAHSASHEAIVAVEHLAGLKPQAINYTHCPNCTYSNPEVGSVGLTETQAKEQGYTLKVGKFPFTAVGKAKVINDTTGFVKIVADEKYDEILGVHIIGPHATELIAEAVPLLRLECTVEELARSIHAHPTLAEAIGEAAHATLGHAIHM